MSDIVSLYWRITPGANLEIKTMSVFMKSLFGSDSAGRNSISGKFPK